MKLSVFAGYLIKMAKEGRVSEDIVFSYAKSVGISMVDINYGEFKNRPMQQYNDLLIRNGFKTSSIYGLCPLASKNLKKFDRAVDYGKKMVDSAAYMGSPNIMVVPEIENDNLIFERERILEGLYKITNYAKGSGVNVTIENFSTEKIPISRVDDIVYLLENIPDLLFTFDVGNFICVDEDMPLAYDSLKGFIKHVHIKDWKYCDEKDKSITILGKPMTGAVIGEGILQIKEFLNKLQNDNYEGALVIEYNSQKPIVNEIDLSAKYLLKNINV